MRPSPSPVPVLVPAPGRASLPLVDPPSIRPRVRTISRAISVAIVIVVLGGTLVAFWHDLPFAQADCPLYTIRYGDTLSRIAQSHGTTVQVLVNLNKIRDPNRIYAGQKICIASGNNAPSDPLEWSSRDQVRSLLVDAADRHGLPRNLVLAIAWQESNWTQHVIAYDGGVGTMQLMPYTSKWLNQTLRANFNPYRTYDNIELGVNYLVFLWRTFPNDLNRVISAYNQGAYAVQTKGIFNWHYVNNVRYFMSQFQ